MTVLGTSFRLGTTSYIWPAEIVPNVHRLGPLVDDVELVLFEADDYSNLPDSATVDCLRALADEHDLSYTVHLPLDLTLADEVAVGELVHPVAELPCVRVCLLIF